MKLIRYSIFEDAEFGHGGIRRTAQIKEILLNHSINQEKILWRRDTDVLRRKNLFRVVKSMFTLSIPFPGLLLRPKRLLRNSINYQQNKKNFEKFKSEKLLLWECTRANSFFIPQMVKGKFKSIIGLPHNIESLVPNQLSYLSGKKAPSWFNEEIKYLSYCDHIFCISKEETYLLNLFGLPANYLPYYPAKKVLEYLLRIRERRKTMNSDLNKKILIFGSADNEPTRMGMEQVITAVKNKLFDSNLELLIAGYNTEQFNDKTLPDQVQVLGELSNTELEDVLVKTNAVLINQEPTTGALTRIQEMLIAGIPLVANFAGARNYYHISGVYVFYNFSELNEIISGILKTPELPEKPVREEKKFIAEILKSFNKE